MFNIPTSETQKMSGKMPWFIVGLFALVSIVLVIVWGHKQINAENERRGVEMNETISKTLSTVSKEHLLVPNIIVFNASPKEQNQITDSFRSQILRYLTSKYASGSVEGSKPIDIHPYISLLSHDSSNSITKEQIEELKKYIEFLSSTVDKAVSESKQNIDTELNKINTWVTIWIGVFGLLGIFIPIVVNFKSFDSLNELQIEAKSASKKASKASQLIDKHHKDIVAIGTIKEEVESLREDIKEVNAKSLAADSAAKDAIFQTGVNKEMLATMHSIYMLKEMGTYIYKDPSLKPITYIKSQLKSIFNSLNRVKANFSEDFYFNLLSQVREEIFQLTTTVLIKERSYSDAIGSFYSSTSDFMNEMPMKEVDRDKFLQEFQKMLDAL